jgi:hypothetical protein
MSAHLRPYQTDIAAEFERHVERSDRSILLVAPTGSGKTVIASAIIAGTARRVLVVAHRREIVNQTSDKLTARGVPHGIIQAGDEKKLRPMAAVPVDDVMDCDDRDEARQLLTKSMDKYLALEGVQRKSASVLRLVRPGGSWPRSKALLGLLYRAEENLA